MGTRTSTLLSVDNPVGEEVILHLASSNPRNFSFSPAQLLVPPFGSAKFNVEYIPSSLGEVETGIITASHPHSGAWTFDVRGRGTHPTTMDPTELFVQLGQGGSGLVNFTNPFKVPVTLNVELQSEEPAGVFALIVKRTAGVSVPAFGQLQLPFAFQPERMSRHEAMLVGP